MPSTTRLLGWRPRLKLRRWQIVCLAILAVPLGRLAWFVYLSEASRQIRIGRETTYLTSPLTEDGYVDYFAAVEQQYADGATVDNNAVVLLWEAFGAKETTPEVWAAQFERLGVPVPANSTVTQIPLDLLVEASRRPKYYAPMIVHKDSQSAARLYGVLIPLSNVQREGIAQLLGRGGQRIVAGDIAAGWEDILACHRLARLVAQDPFVINSLIGAHHETQAIDAAQGLLTNPQLTGEQARRCLRDLRALPAFVPIADKIDEQERVALLDTVTVVARGEPLNPYEEKNQVTLALSGAIDWNIVLAEVNNHFDELAAAMRNPDPAARRSRLQALQVHADPVPPDRMAFGLQAYLFGRSQASRDFARIAIGSIPFPNAFESQTNAVSRMAAAQTGFALVAYQREHGAYPESLAALVPDLLPAAPIDTWSGTELIYRRTDRGFVVYSVGPNLHDDGGGEIPFAGADDERMDDVIFRVEAE